MNKILLPLIALPLLAVSSECIQAASTEQAPRRWLETKYQQPGPRVYGWSYRAERPVYVWRSCGVYRYWDGKACVDARDIPPEM